jgi:hypothetical protein
MLPLILLIWGLPIAAAIWVLLTLARMRRLLEQIAAAWTRWPREVMRFGSRGG